MDLFNEILRLIEQLDMSVKTLRKTGFDYGQAHAKSRLLLSQELLKLEAEGRPVTNLYYIARGKEHVARAKFDEISKEAIYKANLESINAIKLKIRVLEKQLEREYTDIQSE